MPPFINSGKTGDVKAKEMPKLKGAMQAPTADSQSVKRAFGISAVYWFIDWLRDITYNLFLIP